MTTFAVRTELDETLLAVAFAAPHRFPLAFHVRHIRAEDDVVSPRLALVATVAGFRQLFTVRPVAWLVL